MKKMKSVLFAFFFLAFGIGFAQNNAQTREMGFEVRLKDPKADISKYTKAASGFGYFDEFRFLDKRRELIFDDGNAVLVLYSANEMFQNSQKQVSPLTIKEGAAYPSIALAIVIDGNSVKPMPTGATLINK
ncbi:MAG: hypothetical protein K0S33_2372 [Bacteroidetes bacterium]|nr:hypothetical protein [Bacteroidota bacterium]